MGRGRDSRSAQQGQQQGPRPYGQQGQHGPHGGQPPPPHGQWQRPPSYGGGHGEPEYFGDDGYPQRPQQRQPRPQQSYGRYGDSYGNDSYGHGSHGHGSHGHGSHGNNNGPGSTQQFSTGEAPDAYGGGARGGDTYANGSYADGPYGDGPYTGGDGPDDSPYAGGNTYRAGQATAPPAGPRLHWKQLLTGIVMRPSATFWQMRDHAMWGPALIVTFVYGLLAVFGFDKAREDVLSATLSNSVPWVIIAGIMMVIGGLILGTVTHTLARQLGGDGAWAPTTGLSMLIMSITDAPRLVFAMFLGGTSTLVQVLGWATWLAAGYLFTSMVSKSHDLPWPKALGASAIQLIALLSLVKLGTL